MEKSKVLERLLKEDIAQYIKDVTGHGKMSRSHQDQIEFEERVRFWLENQLVPHVLAVACGVFDFDTSVINQKMPELIRGSVTTLPKDAEFVNRMSKDIDPERWKLLEDNLAGSDSPVDRFNDALHSIFS